MEVLADPDALRQRLASWVRDRLSQEGDRRGAAELECELLGAPPSGNSNVTLPFRIRPADGSATAHPAPEPLELVLRLQHPANQIFFDPDVGREFRLLDALTRDPSIRSPRPRWLETDPAVLGHPFFVMARVAGSVPAGLPSIHVTGWLSEQSATDRGLAWASALDALVAIHRFDWQSEAPFLADAPIGTTMRQRLDHLAAWYEWAVDGRSFPVTDAGLAHLLATVDRLAPAPPVLLWGDARMGNIMFGPDARVAAILDWELASIGPAGLDLGWWLIFEEFSTSAHGIEPLAGYPDRRTTIAAYEHRTGAPLADIEWYEICAAWTITVTVIRMTDIAIAAGRLSPDSRMGHGNLTAQILARQLGLAVPPLDRDYAARRNLPYE